MTRTTSSADPSDPSDPFGPSGSSSASGSSGTSGPSGASGESGTVVDRALRTALYAASDDALDTGASLLAAAPDADAELDRRGEEFVAVAWQRGWQPADVARIVGRELGEEHVRLAASLIRVQARHDGPRGRRWTAQLDELTAAEPGRTDRFSYATAVLELYRLLLRLPTLEHLDETAGPAPAVASGAESRMLGRIRALLAKAEATGFPEEAEALSAKAQELMARHSVDEALLAARAPAPDAPGACRIGVEPPYEQAKAVLLDAVATANRCRAVWNEPLGFSTVVGFEAELDVVELLYTSLLVQATTAMAKAEAAQRAGGRKRTKTFRQSFLAAYAHRIGTRLAAAAETQITEDLLPVLASRDLAVGDRLDMLFPETTTTRLRGVSDAAGWTEGAQAADRAQMRSRRRLD